MSNDQILEIVNGRMRKFIAVAFTEVDHIDTKADDARIIEV